MSQSPLSFARRAMSAVVLAIWASLSAWACSDSKSDTEGTGAASPNTVSSAAAGDPMCKETGASCNAADECCSSSCVGGLCSEPVACLPRGAQCWMPGSPPCCEEFCDTDICGGLCQHPGEACGGGYGDCCTGACENGICATCREEGESCAEESFCCGNALVCVADTCTACVPEGTACTMAEECCQNLGQLACAGGACCRPANVVCTVGTECCSGACNGGFCDPS